MSDINMDNVNYFTCTLGQAAKWKQQAGDSVSSFKTAIDLIDGQARRVPTSPALGFARFQGHGDRPVTFQRLQALSLSAADVLDGQLSQICPDTSSTTVALLCTSSLKFILTWLGLVRVGYSVLLLAPQVEPPAIVHLCKTLGINVLFVDEANQSRVRQILDGSIKIAQIASYEEDAPNRGIQKSAFSSPIPEIAYFCHTSGTSSGVPKPIPQTHHGVIGALPCFSGGDKPATFSTTPLYHGGLPDCFRAWTSGASIWFFPEGDAPLTGSNIVKAIEYARSQSSVPVKYFSSVPYILQMLAEDGDGVRTLKTMDLVGVGGAALAVAIGDKLVEAGVNLLSRMGSAECGFLMSSHRDYVTDKEWQYLRPISDSKLLSFDQRENGLSELIVKPDWPFLAKTNADDRSYITSDLFEPHPSKPDVWRYHSRADSQLTLVNGKKFDPAPLEQAILASSDLLKDVLIFGSGKEYAGVLLFPASDKTSEQDLIDVLCEKVKDMNEKSQSHARISRKMLVVVPVRDNEKPLEKSSKGTILRKQAEERYADVIESAYSSERPITSDSFVTDGKLLHVVEECFTEILGRKVDPNIDLYHQGVDSIACIQIRKLIESTCMPSDTPPLPINVIYDQGSVTSLVSFLINLRHGSTMENGSKHTTDLSIMRRLVEKYSKFGHANRVTSSKSRNSIVLTGATGFLGAQILHFLRSEHHFDKIYCFMRSRSPAAARGRLSQALIDRGLPSLDEPSVSSNKNSQIECVPCNLLNTDMGLSKDYRERIMEDNTVIIHSAWTVNFSLPIMSFEDQLAGTRNLINMASENGGKLIFISSTAAVTSSKADNIPEIVSEDPSDASPLGYSQSKWVAEKICAFANTHFMQGSPSVYSQSHPLVSVIRVGQLCGDERGTWNSSEAYPRMLSTAKLIRCLPDIQNEVLNWMPVDLAARAVLEIAFQTQHPNSAREGKGDNRVCSEIKTPVYHVLNHHSSPIWKEMLMWLSDDNRGPDFQTVPPSDWIHKLEGVVAGESPNHPSQALLGLWKDMFETQYQNNHSDELSSSSSTFDQTSTRHASSTIDGFQPLSREQVIRMWRWICQNVGIE